MLRRRDGACVILRCIGGGRAKPRSRRFVAWLLASVAAAPFLGGTSEAPKPEPLSRPQAAPTNTMSAAPLPKHLKPVVAETVGLMAAAGVSERAPMLIRVFKETLNSKSGNSALTAPSRTSRPIRSVISPAASAPSNAMPTFKRPKAFIRSSRGTCGPTPATIWPSTSAIQTRWTAVSAAPAI